MKSNKTQLVNFTSSILTALGLLGFASSVAAGPPPSTWTTLAPVPALNIGVEGASVAQVGNQIIVALGFDIGDRDTTRLYNIDSDTWSFGAIAPGASSEGVGVAHGGLLYSIGGRGAGISANWTYNPSADSWNAGLAPMPTGRAGLAAAVVGNAIYAIGGRTFVGGPCSGAGLAELATVERYDIDTDTWTTVAPRVSETSKVSAYPAK